MFHVIKMTKKKTKKKKQFEGYCQIKLYTLAPYGLNAINELEGNVKWSDKNIFCPMQGQQVINDILLILF